MEKKKIKLIILDYDDTIIKRNLQEVFSGIDSPKDVIDTLRRRHPRIYSVKEALQDVFSYLGLRFDYAKIEEYAQRYIQHYETGKISKKVKDLLLELSKKYILVILTNGGKHVKLRELEYNHIEGVIKEIITPKESGYEKPDKQAFQYILAKYFVSPQEAVSIGNSYSLDIAPAKALGIKTIWVRDEEDIIVRRFEDINESILS